MNNETTDNPPSYDDVIRAEQSSPQRDHHYPQKSKLSTDILPSYDEAIYGLVAQVPVENEPSTSNGIYGWATSTSAVSSPSRASPARSVILRSSPQHDAISLSTIIHSTNTSASVLPYPNFNVSHDANILRNAITASDKDRIMEILCHRSEAQRHEIARLYQRLFGVPLPRTIKNHISTSSDFSVLMCGLSMPLYEFMARAVHNSYSFRWMCHVMFVMPNNLRAAMKNYFEAKYGSSMVKFIKSKIRNVKNHPDKAHESQIIRIFDTVRDTWETVSEWNVNTDTTMLLRLRENKTLKEAIKEIFFDKSFAHIKVVCAEYERRSENTIENFVERNFSYNCFSIQNIIDYARDPVKYFAAVLKKSMKGLGTNEILLTSVVIMRCGVDLLDIKREFNRTNSNSLRKWIKDDTSGYYKYALYNLIKENRLHRHQNYEYS